MIVDFFIGGAPKAGTSSIYDAMLEHPQICCPNIKEGHYFSLPEVRNTYYEVDFIQSESELSSSYRDHDLICGDFSPSYLRYTNSFERLKSNNPNIKAIFILRDPVSRMISHYLMDKSLGYTNKNLDELLNSSKNDLFRAEYLDNGSYHNGIEKALKTFGEKNVLLVCFEKLKEDFNQEMGRIYKFLDVEDIKYNKSVHSNKTKHDKYNLRFYFRKFGLNRIVEKFLPHNIKDYLKSKLLTDSIEHIDKEKYISLFEEEYRYFRLHYPDFAKHWSV